MFYNAYNLVSLNLSSFNTDNVYSMEFMFANCSNLITLDISHFNSSKALISNIFADDTKLEKIICKDERICSFRPNDSQCFEN